MDRKIYCVERRVHDRVTCSINRDTGEISHISRMHPLAVYIVRYNTPRSKARSFECRAENEADAVAQAHQNFARIDAGIHSRDAHKPRSN